MRDSLRTTISAFSSAGGRSQARAANVRAIEPDADLPGAERGNLYMLVEVTGSGGGHPALYRQIFDAAQKAFYETEGTTVTALQRAVRSGHAVLRRVNEALPEANWRAGMTCAALQDAELTIAQVSPALALVSHPKTVDQYPPELVPAATPLGGEDRPEVQVTRTQVEPGSMILLAESRWLEQAQARALAVAAALETPAQAVEYLGQLAGNAELSALLVGLSELPHAAEARPAAGRVPPVIPTRLPEPEPEPQAPPVQAPAFAPPPVVPSAPAEAPSPVVAEPGRRGGLLGRFGRERGEAPSTAAPDTAAAAAAAAAPAPASPVTAPPEPEREFERGQAAYPDDYVDAGAPESAAAAAMGPAPEAAADAAAYAPEPRARRNPLPLILALVIIPLLIAAIVFSMWWLRNRSREADFQQALSGASADIAAAQALSDESAARQRLVSAKEFLDKARAINPTDSRLTPVQASYDTNLDRVNHVTPLYGSAMLWEFTGEGHKLSRVVMKANAVYVLDQGLQQVDRLGLTGLGDVAKPLDPPYALQKKQQVKDSDQVVADLVDIAWVDAVTNQRSRLLALDSAGALYSYDVSFGPARLALAGRDAWGSIPQLIATYNGNLYLVDAKANQIWRYKPTEKGYENAPERYFAEGQVADLSGAQAIAIDGSIWMLYADGRLIKFFTGKQDAFEMKGVPGSLSGAVALAVSAEGDQIYIGDTGNGGRIVEISKKTGQFQRQLRPAGSSILSEMRGLYLDEAGGNFYILTNTRLYKASLPAAGSGPAATAAPAATPAATRAATAAPTASPTPKK